jgi:GMP synthase (glutamine-hydrolysing)
MFPAVLRRADPDLRFVSYDVEHGESPERIDACDGYVITGSRQSVYDDLPWIRALEELTVRLVESRTKLVAVCFGHQLVAHALGGRTAPAERGWTTGVQRCRIDTPFPWAGSTASEVRLIHSHKDQVLELPTGAERIGGNEACPNAFYRIDRHVMSCQGHPEFSNAYARALYQARRETLGEAEYARADASLVEATDRLEVARWISSFLRDRA